MFPAGCRVAVRVKHCRCGNPIPPWDLRMLTEDLLVWDTVVNGSQLRDGDIRVQAVRAEHVDLWVLLPQLRKLVRGKWHVGKLVQHTLGWLRCIYEPLLPRRLAVGPAEVVAKHSHVVVQPNAINHYRIGPVKFLDIWGEDKVACAGRVLPVNMRVVPTVEFEQPKPQAVLRPLPADEDLDGLPRGPRQAETRVAVRDRGMRQQQPHA
mmetsp:Transcript_45144/g.118447  ORF Transcript_45144/g.118447 Transcript_45144/m.118447 type:complete len:208 (+) Transcript_45144:1190-1813(+)